MANPVNWFHISGKDPTKLESFYKKTFAWKTSAGPDGMAFVTAEKGGIPGGIASSPDGKASVQMYVGVANLEQHLEKVQSAGGSLAMPPMDLPGGMGRIAGFLDPESNFVGLWEAGKRPAKRASAKKAAKKAPAKKAAAKKAPAKKAAKKTRR